MNDNSPEESLISIIIVNYNGIAHTREAVLSVLQHSLNPEIILVDNSSTDDSVDLLRNEFSSLTILSLDENRGFGYGCNRGAEKATGKYLFFLNNDAFFREDTNSILSSFLEQNPSLGACGPKLLNADGSFQLSFGYDPSIMNEWRIRTMMQRVRNGDQEYCVTLEKQFTGKNVDWVTGAALMVRRKVFEKIGGFDENFFMYFEDADLCRRIRNAGHCIRYVPQTSVIHLMGGITKHHQTKTSLEYRKSQLYYYRKHLPSLSNRLLRWYLHHQGFDLQ